MVMAKFALFASCLKCTTRTVPRYSWFLTWKAGSNQSTGQRCSPERHAHGVRETLHVSYSNAIDCSRVGGVLCISRESTICVVQWCSISIVVLIHHRRRNERCFRRSSGFSRRTGKPWKALWLGLSRRSFIHVLMYENCAPCTRLSRAGSPLGMCLTTSICELMLQAGQE